MEGTTNDRALRAVVSPRSRIELHGAVLLFGGASLFAKLIDLPAGSQVLGRTVVGSLFMLALVPLLDRSTRSLRSLQPQRAADLPVFGLLGALLAVHWVAFFQAVQVATVSIAVITMATFPVFTALAKPLLLRRRPRTLDLALASIALAGVLLMVGSFDLAGSDTHGVLWGLLAAASFSLLTIINEAMVSGYPSQTIAFYEYTIAAVLLAPFFTDGLAGATGRDWLLLLVLGTVFTALAHTLFISSMRRIRAESASLAVSLEPLYGIGLAWIVLGEMPTARIVAGGTLVLGAVVIGSRTSGAEPRSEPPPNSTLSRQRR